MPERHVFFVIMKDMFTVYIIQSLQTKSYYRGFTELMIQERLTYHNNGHVSSTKNAKPWKIIWYGVFENRNMALSFERYLKSGSGHGFTWKRLAQKTQSS